MNMASSQDETGRHERRTPRAATNQSDEVSQAIRELGSITREAADSVTTAVYDAGTSLRDSVRSAGLAILAALANPQTGSSNGFDSDLNKHHAKRNKGRVLRPLSEKTEREKALLERMLRSNKGTNDHE